MVTVPTRTAVTTPFVTVATDVSLDTQRINGLYAFAGKTDAVMVVVCDGDSERYNGVSVMELTRTGDTVTVIVADRFEPSVVVAVS
jgi:hypothetical protein